MKTPEPDRATRREMPAMRLLRALFAAGYSSVALLFFCCLIHDDPAKLPQASTIGLATAALLAAWGVFIRLNRSAEELEPEAMEKAKSEDEELE